MHIDHINISAPIKLLDEVRDFYCTVLDLSEGYRPEFRRRGYWLYAGEKPLIHLTESSVHYKSDKQGYLDHIAFKTNDLVKVTDKLNSLGVQYSCTEVPSQSTTQLFFKDPAGLGVEVNFDW